MVEAKKIQEEEKIEGDRLAEKNSLRRYDRKFKGFILTSCVLVGVWLVISLRPVTWEMYSVEGYYSWSLGRSEVTFLIYEAFTRDYRLRNSLNGKPIDWILDRFPEASKGDKYPWHSYRKKYEPKQTWSGQPIDSVYWLNGHKLPGSYSDSGPDEEQWGYCVLVREGKIMGFRFVKG